jgi:hypothetical protein
MVALMVENLAVLKVERRVERMVAGMVGTKDYF